jgi:hypothetical protein
MGADLGWRRIVLSYLRKTADEYIIRLELTVFNPVFWQDAAKLGSLDWGDISA